MSAVRGVSVRVVRLLRPLALVVLALGLASCGNESDGVFDVEGFPFTFEYPDEFEETEDVNFDTNLGASADQAAAVAIGENDLIALQRFTLNLAIDRSNLNLAKRELGALIQRLDPSASLSVVEIDGLPALTTGNLDVSTVEDGESRITALFDGDQEYVVNCQSTPDHRDEIAEACDLALETLTLEETSGG